MAENIGERIKILRIEQGMTLAELGEKTCLSISYLSQIERGKTTPSLATLSVIANAFNIGLRFFFEAESETVRVVRARESQIVLTQDSPLVRQPLMPEDVDPKLEIYRVTIKPNTPAQQLEQVSGEQSIFVLNGVLTVTIGDDQFVLEAGDNIHFDALQPHQWSNNGSDPCTMIWASALSLPEF